MDRYIREISSDSRINSLEVSGDFLKLKMALYTGETASIEFTNCYAFCVFQGWSSENISGLKVDRTSALLAKASDLLKSYEAPVGEFYSFQFFDAPEENTLLEVIAPEIKINGKFPNLDF